MKSPYPYYCRSPVLSMPATMLMGLTEHSAELAGYGPIPAQVARELAADGTWRRLLTDPATGHLLDYSPDPRTTLRITRSDDAVGSADGVQAHPPRGPGLRHA